MNAPARHPVTPPPPPHPASGNDDYDYEYVNTGPVARRNPAASQFPPPAFEQLSSVNIAMVPNSAYRRHCDQAVAS